MNSCLEVSAEREPEWLLQAAEDGHAPAMHAFALQCNVLEHRRRWLREAAHEGYVRPCTTMDCAARIPGKKYIGSGWPLKKGICEPCIILAWSATIPANADVG